MAGEFQPHGARPGGTSASLLLVYSGHFFLFCHQYPELLVSSYNNNEDAPHEPDGVALVWNMKYKKTTPEYVFHCQVLFFLFFCTHVLISGFIHDKGKAMPSTPTCCTPLSLSSSFKPPCLRARREFTMLACIYSTSIHKHMFVRWQRRRAVQELNGIRAPQQD